jgi:hypothetical protein
MIASAQANTPQAKFLAMLPAIQARAQVAFGGLPPEVKEDAVNDVVARCYLDYRRLVERDKEHLAFPTVLAMYAIRQYAAGRRVGTKTNKNDISSPASQRRHGYALCHLGTPAEQNAGGWKEMLVETKQAGPADTAASRLDFRAWLGTLNARNRGLAETLATGETTSRTAEIFGISPGRVSQMRRELHDAWSRFHDETVEV